MSRMINTALTMAIKAHEHQADKAGRPYILHPITVATRVEQYLDDNPDYMYAHEPRDLYIAAALLHDVVEDSDITLHDILTEFSNPHLVSALDALTHRKDESYEDYIDRVSKNHIAVLVKYSDLSHNLYRNDTYGQKVSDTKLAQYEAAYDKLCNLLFNEFMGTENE